MLIVVGALVLLLALAPFVPRGGGDDDSLVPSGDQEYGARAADTAGFSKLTPQARAEIDRVVNEGTMLSRRTARTTGKATPEQLAETAVRCAEFEGQRYCLGAGWTHDTEEQVRARTVSAARQVAARPAGAVETTGDLDAQSALAQRARMSPAALARADRAELRMAARSIAKVWLLRHQIEGVPLPEGFLDRHPEARETSTSAAVAKPQSATPNTAKPTKSPSPTSSPTVQPTKVPVKGHYPRRFQILDGDNTAAQTRTYWCGPASMQMIAWGWQKARKPQKHWASRLRTTTSGTSIWDMVRVVNQATGYDRKKYAGPYIVLDIGDYTFSKWMQLMMRHIYDYRAPVVLHPILLKRYYPYLDDDASGHFQVGRGFAKRGKKPDQLGYFEPWNQQRFDPSEPYIARVQWRDAYRSFRANKAHFQHNVGV
ncbi:hypothetical protein JCM10369A_36540 [Nocardioides pyridinolyticus]